MLAAEDDLEIVGEAGNGEEAVAAAGQMRPDVVLMDLRMPRIDGAEATARIVAADPNIKVLILTTYDTDSDIIRAVEAGATGYLLKDTPGRNSPLRCARQLGVRPCSRRPWPLGW